MTGSLRPATQRASRTRKVAWTFAICGGLPKEAAVQAVPGFSNVSTTEEDLCEVLGHEVVDCISQKKRNSHVGTITRRYNQFSSRPWQSGRSPRERVSSEISGRQYVRVSQGEHAQGTVFRVPPGSYPCVARQRLPGMRLPQNCIVCRGRNLTALCRSGCTPEVPSK